MPRQEYVLSVFVASPSDVGDERTKLEEVIRELNITWSRELGLRLDLVRWETHAFPGAGDDAQAVINEQIVDDCDLFVGIMWCRYGTATGRAESGTQEEFLRAKSRYDRDHNSVKLMIYFKDEPIPPSQLNPTQLTQVMDFRDSLGEEGVLYWKFNDVDEFGKLVRIHLTRQVQAWKRRNASTVAAASSGASSTEGSEQQDVELKDDDLGILDYYDIFEDKFSELNENSERISSATEELGNKMTARASEMDSLPRDSQGNTNRKVARRTIGNAASDMNQYTARMEVEVPIFASSLNCGLAALIKAIELVVEGEEIDTSDRQHAEEGLSSIESFIETLEETGNSMKEFQTTVRSLPRLTSDLNRSKRGVVAVLTNLIGELDAGQTLLRESKITIQELLGN